MKDFSIVIPAFNEELYIEQCIESVLRLNYPNDRLSIHVVDNGSSDQTYAIAKKYPDIDVTIKNGGQVGSVRNHGASLSSSKYIAFLDSDCIVPESWLNDAVEALQDNAIGAVGGGYLANQSGSWVEAAWVVEQQVPYMETEALAGGCFIVRRSVFNEVAGFNEELGAGEDDELTQRIIKQGYKVQCVSRLAVIHLGYPKRLRDIVKRQVWHGSSQLYSAKTFFDPMLVLTHLTLVGLLVSIFMIINGSFFIGFLAAIGSLLFPSIIAFYKKSSKKGFRRVPLIKAIQLIVIYVAFFIGRSYGLFKNYIHLITKKRSILSRG